MESSKPLCDSTECRKYQVNSFSARKPLKVYGYVQCKPEPTSFPCQCNACYCWEDNRPPQRAVFCVSYAAAPHEPHESTSNIHPLPSFAFDVADSLQRNSVDKLAARLCPVCTALIVNASPTLMNISSATANISGCLKNQRLCPLDTESDWEEFFKRHAEDAIEGGICSDDVRVLVTLVVPKNVAQSTTPPITPSDTTESLTDTKLPLKRFRPLESASSLPAGPSTALPATVEEPSLALLGRLNPFYSAKQLKEALSDIREGLLSSVTEAFSFDPFETDALDR